MSSVMPLARAVARAAATAFGADSPSVRRYYDEAQARAIDVMACADRPTIGFTTYSTVSLHQAPNLIDNADVRVELAAVGSSSTPALANLLATAAFYVMKNRWLAAPGVVFPGLVKECGMASALEHLMWAPPFPWEELGPVQVPGEVDVHWLLAVPISERERVFLVSHGFDALEQLFTERDVAYFDLSRPSLL